MNKPEKFHVDEDGYRPNVGIVLCNRYRQVLWARRATHDGWQFPQGGVEPDESLEQAVFRELHEEVGLLPEHVKLVGRTQDWLRYDVPPRHLRRRNHRGFKGQKQVWFLFHLVVEDSAVYLNHSDKPEFDSWRWVDYWTPLSDIVEFKKAVYHGALRELEPFLRCISRSATGTVSASTSAESEP